MALELFSEPVGPNGNIQAVGIINQLGRPTLDPLVVLVREAVQNSWDARASDKGIVEFGLIGWTLDNEQLEYLKKNIFAKIPESSYLPLGRVLSQKFDVLAIYDRGTVGLGGPTRADIYNGNDARDFVDFVRNVGQPSDKRLSGGTYGYGKAAFYRFSKAKTIIVYTRCIYQGKYQSRLIACALGDSYTSENRIYTGRHWWGEIVDGIAEPVLDEKADHIAERLGIQKFSKKETGTTIVIIAPNFSGDEISDQPNPIPDGSGRTPSQALNYAAECILWYFWPKMLSLNRNSPAMKFHISWQGKEVKLPRPEDYEPLRGFVHAMQLVKKGASPSSLNHMYIPVASQRPYKRIGSLAIHMFPIATNDFFDKHEDDKTAFSELTHHTAIMRTPELVVNYIPGPVLSSDWFGYGGVFIADKEVDEIFARAEPPTHDNWVIDSLEDQRSRSIVRKAIREMKSSMENFSKPNSVDNSQGTLVPLGSFASRLGESIFTSIVGTAAVNSPPMKYIKNNSTERRPSTRNSSDRTPIIQEINLDDTYETKGTIFSSSDRSNNRGTSYPGDGSSKKVIGKSKVDLTSDGEYVLVDGKAALEIHFVVQHGENADGTFVKVKTYAIVDGSQPEAEPPIGGSTSAVLCWVNPEGMKLKGSEQINIPSNDTGEWKVIVSIPEDIVLGVDLSG